MTQEAYKEYLRLPDRVSAWVLQMMGNVIQQMYHYPAGATEFVKSAI